MTTLKIKIILDSIKKTPWKWARIKTSIVDQTNGNAVYVAGGVQQVLVLMPRPPRKPYAYQPPRAERKALWKAFQAWEANQAAPDKAPG